MCEQLCGRDRDQPAALHYARLRAMDPLAFEELLLEAFERRGHRVIRNRRYTGDGGVDGEVIIDGQRWLIQAKRYRDAIKPEHVREFAHALRHPKAARHVHPYRPHRRDEPHVVPVRRHRDRVGTAIARAV
jgi:restriction endonuclease Mrr